MGSGKSTLGLALGRATGFQFVDLDTFIERRFHAKISDIFVREGESAFRDKERRMLCEVCAFEDTIIACGGGTPCFFDNIDVMNRSGLTVYLDASEERLFERLKLGRRRRPLIAAMTDNELRAYISGALSSRMPHYIKSAVTFPSDRLDTQQQIEETVALFISRFLPDRLHPEKENYSLINT